MSHQFLTFETVEDMVAHVLTRPAGKTNYKLEVRVNLRWDDPKAGEAWMARLDVVGWGQERGTFLKNNVRPAEHNVTSYGLQSVGDSWSWAYIKLSAELGKAIEDAWPKKQGRWDSEPKPHGHRTLAGVLKLLGRSDIGRQIADAKAKDKEEQAKADRALVLRHIEKLARELAEYIGACGGKVGVDYVTVGRGKITMYDPTTNVVKEIQLNKEAEA